VPPDSAAPAGAPAVDPAVLQALRAGDPGLLAGALHNDLAAAAIGLAPELDEVLRLGASAGALAGLVSGSGPTLAFLAEGADEAISLAVTLSSAGHTAAHVHGPVHGARVLR
jgi:4-diphosphocytidyl-2-C-methyl-D-erythritol kinase